MARLGRPPSCLCGECAKCKHRIYMREWYGRKTPEERRAWRARRDPERVRANDLARHRRQQEQPLEVRWLCRSCHVAHHVEAQAA